MVGGEGEWGKVCTVGRSDAESSIFISNVRKCRWFYGVECLEWSGCYAMKLYHRNSLNLGENFKDLYINYYSIKKVQSDGKLSLLICINWDKENEQNRWIYKSVLSNDFVA